MPCSAERIGVLVCTVNVCLNDKLKPKLPRTLDATLILPTIILTWTHDPGRIV